MDIKFPHTKRDLKHHLSRIVSPEEKCRMDVKALQRDVQLQNHLSTFLENRLESLPTDDVDLLNEEIVSAVKEGMEEVSPKIEPKRKKEPWIDPTLEDLTKELRRTTNDRVVRQKHKEIKERRKILKNRYYREIADGINTAAQAREVEKEFAMMKKYSILKTKKVNPSPTRNSRYILKTTSRLEKFYYLQNLSTLRIIHT